MATGPRSVSTRRALLAACCLVGLAILLVAGGDSAQAAGPIGPDVTVFDFTDIGNFGSSGGFAAYSLGTNACNRGDTPLAAIYLWRGAIAQAAEIGKASR